MERSNNTRFTARSLTLARKGILLGFAFLLPFNVMAQVYVCSSNIDMDATGEEPYFIDEAIPIELTLSAGEINNSGVPGVLQISSFDYKPDCVPSPDANFENCADAGNNVVISTPADQIGGTCGADFSVATSDGGVTYEFTPSEPIVLPANDSCTVTFDITVLGAAPGTTGILETSGWSELQAGCYETDGTYYGIGTAASGSLTFPLSTERAQFVVTKDFTDDSDGSADVYIRCNAGLPLEQEFTLQDGERVTFVVREFLQGTMDCRIFEDPIEGYDESYEAGGTGFADLIDVDNGCIFEGVQSGSFTCDITNAVEEVEIEVTKTWMGVNEEDMVLEAQAQYTCYDVYTSGAAGQTETVTGSLSFSGLTSTRSITGIYPAVEGSYCEVSEPLVESFVEADVSDCANIPVEAGASCTIVNTVFYEGIPTLNSYGLALLALLMLGVGFVGMRRLV
jgi:hypothetical protein